MIARNDLIIYVTEFVAFYLFMVKPSTIFFI
jgi:hypothetical protein